VGPVRIPQKRVKTPYAELVFLHRVVSAGHVVHSDAFRGAKRRSIIFHARVGLVRFP
jgi:hypothetical protein